MSTEDELEQFINEMLEEQRKVKEEKNNNE